MWELLSVSSADPTSWTQLGVTGIVAATWFLVASKLWIDNRAKDKTIGELHNARLADRDAQMAREQDRLERTLPLLQGTADVLKRVIERLDRPLGGVVQPSEVDALLRQLHSATQEMQQAAEKLDRRPGGGSS